MRISPLSVSQPDVKPAAVCNGDNGVTDIYDTPDFINGAFFSNSITRYVPHSQSRGQPIRVDTHGSILTPPKIKHAETDG